MDNFLAMIGSSLFIKARQYIILKYCKDNCLPHDEEDGADDDSELNGWPEWLQWFFQTVEKQYEVVIGKVGGDSNHPIDCRFNGLGHSII